MWGQQGSSRAPESLSPPSDKGPFGWVTVGLVRGSNRTRGKMGPNDSDSQSGESGASRGHCQGAGEAGWTLGSQAPGGGGPQPDGHGGTRVVLTALRRVPQDLAGHLRGCGGPRPATTYTNPLNPRTLTPPDLSTGSPCPPWGSPPPTETPRPRRGGCGAWARSSGLCIPHLPGRRSCPGPAPMRPR